MKVSELLCDESKWCKGSNAVDAQGNEVYCHSADAVRWCLLGAFLRCRQSPLILGQITNRQITVFNDDSSTTFQEVLGNMKKARYEN